MLLSGLLSVVRECCRFSTEDTYNVELEDQAPLREVLQEAPQRPEVQCVYVVRHGERVDDVDDSWTSSAPRPFDPHLTETGFEEAAAVGETLAALPSDQRPAFVVTSPFLRCWQTAEKVCRALEYAADDGRPPKLLVAWDLAEIMNPAVLKVDENPSFSNPPDGRPATRIGRSQPEFPEERADALLRYEETFHSLPEHEALGGQNVVFVTHGEAVGRAVSCTCPGAMVFNVAYCGYVTLKRSGAGLSLVGDSGETGVNWLID
eukprot:Hpha_TRINITY_DN952_c0_g1::TRINITY_DN952_c0_g1_i2::g.156207::m.156207